MAIQMRRGLKKDFDPNKMLPGEWAVSIDSVTSNQIVWMCFAAGVCKRMGTYEDFYAQIAEATEDIRDAYIAEFEAIKETIQAMADTVSSDKEEILIVKSDIVNTYLPQIHALVERAETAELSAEIHAINSSNSATLSQSYAVGGTGTREGEDADNAKYYYRQAMQISQGGNGLVPMGTIAFESIPTTDIMTNAMYNISNDFTSDERFVDGGGVLYGKGSNIFYTVDGLWDVLAASDVKGVKGAAEDTYRQGNVNITPANIGLGNVDNTSDVDKPISKEAQAAFDEVNEAIGTIEENLTTVEAAVQKNAEDIATANSNLSTKANKRNYVAAVVGTKKVTLDASVYKVECMILPYPSATTKAVIPIAFDVGALSYAIGVGNYLLTYGGTDYYAEILVEITGSTKSISLKGVKWSNEDVTSTAKLIITSVSST